jgi:glycosyltransferase involved in cell wall biosynthesis
MSTIAASRPVRISVVLPAYNAERFLGEALRSILAQSQVPDEICVVDDGSTDQTSAIARSTAGVRCLPVPHGGQARALNAGVDATTGDLLAFLDADDRWLPDKLARQLAAFDARHALGIVYGHARQFVEPGVPVRPGVDGRVLPARLPSAMLVRRDAWQRVGPFSSEWSVGSVVEWCARAEDAGVLSAVLDDVVYERRIHGANTTLSHPAAAKEYLRMLKEVMDRREVRRRHGAANAVQSLARADGERVS